MNMNVLKDKVVAAFRISDIERKDWDTTVNHEGKLVKVKATKFIAKMLHDQKHSEETGGDDNLGDYAVQRDPAAALTLSYYCWGYKYNGKMHVSVRKPDGNEFGMSFLKPADWTRLLKTAGYSKETKKYPLPVFVKVKLSGTRNYLGEFGGIELKTAQAAILNEMDDMLTSFEAATESESDDMPGADGETSEADRAEWIRPERALATMAEALMPPTIAALEDLATARRAADLVRLRRDVTVILPVPHRVGDGWAMRVATVAWLASLACRRAAKPATSASFSALSMQAR